MPRSSKLYMPYGGWRWGSGTLPTARQFTGQVSDATSGLDYYNARYYDPALGQFTSADTVMDGLDRYAYAGDNPTTNVDPSGHDWWSDAWNNTVNAVGQVLDFVTGFSASISDVQTLTDDKASLDDKIVAGADLTLNVVTDVALLTGVGEGLRALDLGAKAADMGVHALERMGDDTLAHGTEAAAGDLAESAATQTASDATDQVGASAATDASGCGLSFAADTPVLTPSGEHAINSLRVGDALVAYDPATQTSGTQTVQQVFLNHDIDLLDVTVQPEAPLTPSEARLARAPLEGEPAGRAPPPQDQATQTTARAQPQPTPASQDETVHTTANHPWLTADRGWVQAGTLHAGERVVRADGSTAVVVGLHTVPGAAVMWDLTVSQVHTFAVGAGEYVVHNCAPGVSNVDSTDPKAFEVTDWSGYPSGSVPKPQGPFKLLEGQEYDAAREAGDKGARTYGRQVGKPSYWESHHIQPVKFGGSPSAMQNFIPLPRATHQLYSAFWDTLQGEIESGNFRRIRFLNP